MKKLKLSIAVLTVLGSISLQAGSEGDAHSNVYYGDNAGSSLVGGTHNMFIGLDAGKNTSEGTYNTFSGRNSGLYNTTGSSNTFNGTSSGIYNTIGNSNTFSGTNCGNGNKTGSQNTFMGYRSGYNADINSSVLLGYQAGYYANRDNTLYIANSDTNTSLIYGEFDTKMMRVNGTLEINSTKVDISEFKDGTAWAYPALTLTASDLSDSFQWLVGLITEGDTDGERALVFRNQITDQNPFIIANDSKAELLKLHNESVLIHGETIDIDAISNPANLIVGGDINAIWEGSNTLRDGTKYLVSLSADNDDGSKTSDAGFALENKRENFKWEFRTYEAGQGFTATKAHSGGGEFRVENTTTDFHNAKMIVGGVTIFENGHLVTASSRTLKTNIEPLDTQAALDAFHNLQPVSYEYKAQKGEPVVGFIAEDIPDLVAMPSRHSLDSTEIVAVLTKVVQEQDKVLSETRKELKEAQEKITRLETMEKKVAMMESILTNLALNTANSKKEKVSLNK